MNLFQLALRNLRRRPMRTTLAAVGVALAVGSAIALLGLSGSIEASVQKGVDERGVDLVVTQKGSTDLFSGVLPQSLGPRLRTIPGVTGVGAEYLNFASTEDGRQVLVSAWARDSFFWGHVPLAAGRLPKPGEHDVALVGDALSDTLAKKVGDQVNILGVNFRIVGETRYASTMNRGLLIVPLEDLQAATYRQGQVTGFDISIDPKLSEDQVSTLKQRILAVGGVYVSTTGEIVSGARTIKILHAISLATSGIALAMGVMNLLNAQLMAVQERTREMGVLAAIGWKPGLVVRSILLEGLIICAAGSAAGVGVGYLASWMCGAIPVIGAYLDFWPTPDLIALTVAGAFVFSFLGCLYPALRAVSMTPAAALQRI